MTVSIIIAVKTQSRNLEECVVKCLDLDYPDFEILIFPDEPFGFKEYIPKCNLQVISTGGVSPAQKRDIALKYAKGEIFAFLDDDAYPARDWLKQAITHFTDKNIAAVGGPGVTPKEDNLRQFASGRVYSSILVSGRFVYRYTPKKRLEVDDLPSCNFLIRKNVFEELGGFNTNFWPGEDTKLCLDIVQKLGKKIIYEPKAVVFHHRRPLFMPHIRQIANYALHRGYFVKRYPQTSLKFVYFLPSILISGIFLSLIVSLFSGKVRDIYLSAVSLYIIIVFLFSLSRKLRLIPFVFFGIIITHLVYGIYFLKGLLVLKLEEEKR
ncbi:MAG: glycosyltransferase [Candidatus Omnitrophota bacterium]|nr:glycosyltransferase [Candidatus Omnitrophota bacterium]